MTKEVFNLGSVQHVSRDFRHRSSLEIRSVYVT